MFKKQGTSKRSASTSIGDIKPGFDEATPTDMGSQASAGDMAWACCEELVELDDVQLATVVGAGGGQTVDVGAGGGETVRENVFKYILKRWGEEEKK